MHGAAASLLRDRTAPAPVAQVELFFDLIFVFAVTQLSAFIRAHMDAAGAGQALMLFAAMWWGWVFTSWVTNWLDPARRPVKLLLLGLMLCALALAAALPQAFGRRSFGFALGLAALQLGRSLFMLWALKRHDARNYRNFQRIGAWLTVSALLWLAGGLAGNARLWFWLPALALDLAGPACGFFVPGLGRSASTEWQVDARHLAERCAGFILIALGESVTVTGENFSALHWRPAVCEAALAALAGAACLWWIYFDDAAERTAAAFAGAADKGRIARAAYTYVHGLLVGAIIMLAAGDAFLLEDPLAPAALGPALLLLGGPAAFLLGNGWFRRLLHPRFPRSHLAGFLLLALAALAAPALDNLALGVIALAALLATILVSNRLRAA